MQTRAVTAHHGCWEFLNEDRGDKGNITSPVPASAQLSEQEQQRRGTGGAGAGAGAPSPYRSGTERLLDAGQVPSAAAVRSQLWHPGVLNQPGPFQLGVTGRLAPLVAVCPAAKCISHAGYEQSLITAGKQSPSAVPERQGDGILFRSCKKMDKYLCISKRFDCRW